MLYLQLAAFPLLALAGILTGLRLAKSRWWLLAVALPLALFALVILGHRSPALRFAAVVAWAVDADINPLLMTAAIGIVFATLLPKLPRKSTRGFVIAVMAVMLLYYGLLPPLLPLAVRPSLAATPTRIDRNGICLQRHAYSCGPAAAVTCLRRLGLPADEGALAVAARCAPVVGTDGHVLAAAVTRDYPSVACQYRYVSSLDDLRLPAVADMEIPWIGGHYVAVLEVQADVVMVGDPLSGLGQIPRAEFLAQWKHGAIEFPRRENY